MGVICDVSNAKVIFIVKTIAYILCKMLCNKGTHIATEVRPVYFEKAAPLNVNALRSVTLQKFARNSIQFFL